MVRFPTPLLLGLVAVPGAVTAFTTLKSSTPNKPLPTNNGHRFKSRYPQYHRRAEGIRLQSEESPPRGPIFLEEDQEPLAKKDPAEVGKDIFLANLASAPEEMLLGDIAASTTEQDNTNSSLDGGGGIEQKKITENVEAVMAASKDAMVAAEATLPPEVKEAFGTNSSDDIIAMPTFAEEQLVDIVPAEEVVGEPVTHTAIDAPSVMKILKFAVPAVAVWMCSPILSLIDTSAVGTLSGTVQQAALSPAVAVTDYAALLIAFLFTSTTNQVAAAQASDRTVAGRPRATKTIIGAMQLSSYVGVGLGAALMIFARPLLRAIIGNDAIDPAVFAAAMKYVRIRALGMPAAAIIGSAQAASLGMQDLKSPLYVLVAAAVVNFLGDMIFVGSNHPIIGGAAGAAWATVFSQYAALTIFIRWLATKPKGGKALKVVDLTQNIKAFMSGGSDGSKRNRLKELVQAQKLKLDTMTKKKATKVRGGGGLFGKFSSKTAKATPSTPTDDSFSVRGMLDGKFRGLDLLKLPAKDIAKEFLPYVAPVTVTQIGRVSGYIAMSHVVSSSLGTISMAAQQVIVSFFYCLTPIADSLSLTAQSFIPGISERKASKERAAALRKSSINFLKAGGVFGVVMAAAIGLMPLLSGLFTADIAVRGLVNMVVPLLVAFFVVHGVLCAAEGLLLGQKDLGFLGKMYGAYFFAVPYFMLRVKKAALSGVQGINLTSIWTVFVGYQMFRLVAWVARVGLIQRKTDRAAVALEESF